MISSLIVSTSVDAIHHLCLADCLDFYTIVPTLLHAYITNTTKSNNSKTRQEQDSFTTFTLTHFNDPCVVASICLLFECGIEHLGLICDDSDDDMHSSSSTSSSRLIMIYEVTRKSIHFFIFSYSNSPSLIILHLFFFIKVRLLNYY
jgi:hypothetical protein